MITRSMKIHPMRAVICGASILLLSACSSPTTRSAATPAAAMPESAAGAPARARQNTLYDALGGAAGIETLSEKFIIELAADERVRHHYEKSDIGRFHRMMQLQICELADGPCVYTGDNMKRTHGGMNIQSAEFNAVVEALMRAMDSTGLNPGTQNRLLALMAPMRADIVGH